MEIRSNLPLLCQSPPSRGQRVRISSGYGVSASSAPFMFISSPALATSRRELIMSVLKREKTIGGLQPSVDWQGHSLISAREREPYMGRLVSQVSEEDRGSKRLSQNANIHICLSQKYKYSYMIIVEMQIFILVYDYRRNANIHI